MMVTGQWFYRPEEAERQCGGNWKSHDTRDLFYSFHRDEVPAESVMHKCVVHFVPLHKQLPRRKQHPGFIVQNVYDFAKKKLWKLTDKIYEEHHQQEIDDLVLKTLQRLGDLPDVVIEEAPAHQEDRMKTKKISRRGSISPLNVSRDERRIPSPKNDQHLQPETPGSSVDIDTESHCILAKFKALTGDIRRDKWLERLLLSVQGICVSDDSIQIHDKEKDASAVVNSENSNRSSKTENECQDKAQKVLREFLFIVVDSCTRVFSIIMELFLSQLSFPKEHMNSEFVDSLSTDFQVFCLARLRCSSHHCFGKGFT